MKPYLLFLLLVIFPSFLIAQIYLKTQGGHFVSTPDGKVIKGAFPVFIPGGTFTMGSPSGESGRWAWETQWTVTLSPFRMTRHEITNAQFAAFLNVKGVGSDRKYSSGAYPNQVLLVEDTGMGLTWSGTAWVPAVGFENSPMVFVTWYGAAEFASYVGGSLPTEAQWEYACRAGTTTPFNTGSCLSYLEANYFWTSPYFGCSSGPAPPNRPLPVGSFPPNGYGLHDMHGNVREWCSDWYADYPSNTPSTPITDPTGSATGTYRICRGGFWMVVARDCRSAFRIYNAPGVANSQLGFRVVFNH